MARRCRGRAAAGAGGRFLACVLVLARLCNDDGLFRACGAWLARRSGGRAGSAGPRLLAGVFVVASVTTAVLSLDATVVLLTPVVLAAASRAGARARPQALLAIACLAAVLPSVVNNLPAVLVLLPLAAPSGAGAVLAVLLGVNIGPNLTYTGSLATLLWRRELRERGCDVSLAEFTRLGMLTVIPSLALCVLALWAGLHVLGGLASA